MKIKTAVQAMGYMFQIEWDDIGETVPAGGWFTDIINFFGDVGLEPAASAQKAAPAAGPRPANSNGGGNGYNRNGGTPAPRRPMNAGGYSCPVHGTENIGAGYQGRGQECKVWTADPVNDDPNGEWCRIDENGNYKGSQARDGSTRYYCRFRSGGN